MANQHTIIKQLDVLEIFEYLAKAYEELAIIKMTSIRQHVLQSRVFLAKLYNVYQDVQRSYEYKKTHTTTQTTEAEENRPEAIQVEAEKKGNLVVFVSSTSKLYGEIIRKIFDDMVAFITTEDADVMVIGRLGYQLFKDRLPNHPFLYFDMNEREFTQIELQPMLFQLLKYKKITVFHGKYSSLMLQESVKSVITGQEYFEAHIEEFKNVKKASTTEFFFFEPTIETIVHFFETQVTYNLFKQTLNESDLARSTSRIKAMEILLENIQKQRKALLFKQIQFRKRNEFRTLVQQYSSYRL